MHSCLCSLGNLNEIVQRWRWAKNTVNTVVHCCYLATRWQYTRISLKLSIIKFWVLELVFKYICCSHDTGKSWWPFYRVTGALSAFKSSTGHSLPVLLLNGLSVTWMYPLSCCGAGISSAVFYRKIMSLWFFVACTCRKLFSTNYFLSFLSLLVFISAVVLDHVLLRPKSIFFNS